MSDYAVTPETYTAWRFLEVYDELRPDDGARVEILRRNEELGLLLAGTRYICSHRGHVLTLDL